MSERGSGYERKERDQYITPAWVTGALPACGTPLDGQGARGDPCGRDRNEIVTRPTLNNYTWTTQRGPISPC